VLEGEELTTRIALSGGAIFLGVGVVIYAEWRRRVLTASTVNGVERSTVNGQRSTGPT